VVKKFFAATFQLTIVPITVDVSATKTEKSAAALTALATPITSATSLMAMPYFGERLKEIKELPSYSPNLVDSATK